MRSFGGSPRPGLFDGDRRCLCSLLFPLALHRALAGDQVAEWQGKAGWLVAAAILLLVIPARSRAAWLALMAGGGFVLAHHWHLWDRVRQLAIWKKVGLVTVILAMLGSGIYGIYRLKPDSADGRLLIWKVSAGMVAEHPWFGRGFARFAPEYMLAQADYFASGQGTEREELLAGQVNTAYNEFLQLTVELGVIGLVLFLWVLALGLTTGANASSSIWSMTLVSWLVFASFSYPGYSWPMAILLIVALAGLAKTGRPVKRWTHKITGIVAIVGSVVLTLIWIWQTQPGIAKWQEALTSYNHKDYRGALAHFQDAYRVLEHEGLFLQQAAKTMQQNENYQGSNGILKWSKDYYNDPFTYSMMGENFTHLQFYDRAEDAYQRSHHMVPHRLWPQYLMVKMLWEMGEKDRSKELARKLVSNTKKIEGKAAEQIIEELRYLLIQQGLPYRE